MAKKKKKENEVDVKKLKLKAAELLNKGKYKKALSFYLRISENQPKDLRIKTKVGDILAKLKRKDEAIAIYKNVAAHYAQDGLLIQAIAVNKLILHLNPEDQGIQKALASLYSKRGLKKGKSVLADMATKIKPIRIQEVKAPENEKVVEAITSKVVPLTPPPPPPEAPKAKKPPKKALTPPPPVQEEVEALEISISAQPREFQDEEIEITGELVVDFSDAVDLNAISEVSLPPTPLFSALDATALEEVLELIKRREMAKGEVVCREDEAGDSIFIISDGSFVVTCLDQSQKLLELATLEAGDFFGEFGYFSGRKRHATVTAKDEGVLLELARQDIDALLKKHPGVGEIMVEFYKNRLLDNLMSKSRIFRVLTPEEKKEIATRFHPEAFNAGSILMREGEDGDAMYLIQEGQLKVTTRKGSKEVPLATLREGDFCGEFSILTDAKRTADVVCLSDCKLLRLSKEDARDVMSQNQKVHGALKQVADERVAGTIRALAMVSTTANEEKPGLV